MAKSNKQKVEPVASEATNLPTGPLGDRLVELEQALKQKEDQLLRTLADFDNYRKRVAREMEESGKAGKRDLLLGLLSVVDSFDRAFQSEALKQDQPVYSGLKSIYRQLHQLLEQQQVISFESLGQRFDPNLHHAAGTEVSERHSEGTVTEELQKGYLWEGKIFRPSEVIVSRGERVSAAPIVDVWE